MEACLKFLKNSSAEEISIIKSALIDREFDLGIGRYSKAKVYGCYNLSDDSIFYVGSTIKAVKTRWSGHIAFFKQCPSSSWTQHIMSNGGPDNFELRLIEAYPCRSFKELLAREKSYIASLKPICNIAMNDRLTKKGALLQKKEVKKQAAMKQETRQEFRLANRQYLAVRNLKPTEFSLLNKKYSKDRNNINFTQEIQLERYWYDEKIIKSVEDDPHLISNVFQKIDNDTNFNLFLNISIGHKGAESHVGHSVITAKHSVEDLHHTEKIMKCLTEFNEILGLTSWHDTKTLFSRALLEDKQDHITQKLEEIYDLLKTLHRSTAKDPIQCLKNNISYVFEHMCGLKVAKHVARHQENGSRKRIVSFHFDFSDDFLADAFKVIIGH